MPLPFILGAGAILAAGWGAKKGYDAYCDNEQANEYHEQAKRLYEEANFKLENKQKDAENAFLELGELSQNVVSGGLKFYEELVEKLDFEGLKTIGDIELESFKERLNITSQDIITINTALGGLGGGAALGALTGFGTFGAAGLLASASTGTAISALSGVAATNATLAWFGGGSLAAGGLGMAGGTLVLGSIVAAPVIAVVGAVFAAKAEEKKYNMLSYLESIGVLCEAMEIQGLSWRLFKNRANVKINSIEKCHRELILKLNDAEATLHEKGSSVSLWSDDERENLKTLAQIAETLTAAIKAPLMFDEDKLTKRLHEQRAECERLMDKIKSEFEV